MVIIILMSYQDIYIFNNIIKDLNWSDIVSRYLNTTNKTITNKRKPLTMVEKDYHENGGEKGTRFLGAKAVNILNKWFMENREYPYPNETTTDWLARQASIKKLH